MHWTVFRGLTNLIPMWIILIGIGGAFAVVSLEFFDGTNAFLALVLVTAWHLPVLQMALERMTPFDPLPISRRALWAHTFGPVALAVVIGALIAQVVYRVNPPLWSAIHSQSCCLEVPWEYLEIAPDGAAPTVTAPWGESLTPATDPLWRGRRPALYDPYEVTAESSPGFIEFQIRRAVAAVYGVPLRSNTSSTDPQMLSNAAGEVDRDDFIGELTRGHKAEGRNRSAAVTLMLFTLLGYVLVLPALCQYGPSVHRKIFKWASWGALMFLGMVAVAVAVARLAGYTEVWYVGALVSIGIRHLAEWMPVSTGILWISVVTFWFGCVSIIREYLQTDRAAGP